MAAPQPDSKPAFLRYLHHPWVQHQFRQMSPRARLAQLLQVPGWSDRGPEHEAALARQVKETAVGGITFFQGTAGAQAALTARLQRQAATPLLISIDAEWGLAMRLRDTAKYPYAMTLGASGDLKGIEALAAELGQQCRRLGVHLNLAPVADLNTEPANPVIGVRSFGAEPAAATAAAAAYARGLAQQHILACAKHFPGHGDTRQDSHHELPVVPHDRARLEAVELAPFRALIHQGIGGVMTAHLQVPALDPASRVATVSPAIVRGCLQGELGFEGLVISDALDMQGLGLAVGEREVAALAAGHDLLLFVTEPETALDAIEAAIAEGRLQRKALELSCQKILAAKAWVGLETYAPPLLPLLEADRHPPRAKAIVRRLAARAQTWLKGPASTLAQAEDLVLVSVVAGQPSTDQRGHHALTGGQAEADKGRFTSLQVAARRLRPGLRTYRLRPGDPWPEEALSCQQLIVGVHGLDQRPRTGAGLPPDLAAWLAPAQRHPEASLVWFSHPYLLQQLPDWQAWKQVLLSWEDRPAFHQAAAKVLLKGAAAKETEERVLSDRPGGKA